MTTEPTAEHRPLSSTFCVCGEPNHTVSAEPTAEQQALAYDLLDCEKADDPFPYCDAHGGSWPCADATRIARALAAAVTAEREKVVQWVLNRRDEAGAELRDGTTNPAWVVLDDVAIGIREVTR